MVHGHRAADMRLGVTSTCRTVLLQRQAATRQDKNYTSSSQPG